MPPLSLTDRVVESELDRLCVAVVVTDPSETDSDAERVAEADGVGATVMVALAVGVAHRSQWVENAGILVLWARQFREV